MNIEQARILLQPFMDACQESGDKYFITHFATDEDNYQVLYEADPVDLELVITNVTIIQKQLANEN